MLEKPKKQDTALALIDQAGKIIRAGHVEADPYFLRVELNDYYYHRASALIQAGRNRDALQELKLTKEKFPRGQVVTAILQAQTYFNAGKYERAASFAEYALEIAQEINSDRNIARIRKLFRQLQQSPYKDNPAVARLDYMLSKR